MSASNMRVTQYRSPVGDWWYYSRKPAPDLSHAVAGLWAVEGDTRGFQEKVVPRSTVELMVNLGGPHSLLSGDAVLQRQTVRDAWVSGLQRECLWIESLSKPHFVAASIRPAYASPLLGAEGSEVAGRVEELESVSGRTVRELRERMLDAPSPEARFDLLESYLRRRLAGARQVDPALSWAAGFLALRAGRVPAQSLSEAAGISHRHFIRRFRSAVGLAPKLYARLVRFEQTIAAIQQRRPVRWTQLAHELEFFDQAHLTKEFRSFTGMAPSQFEATCDASGQAIFVD